MSGQPHREGSCFLASLGPCKFREQGLALLASGSPSVETTAWRRQSGWEPLLTRRWKQTHGLTVWGSNTMRRQPMVRISENTNGNGLSQTMEKTNQVMLA